MEIKEAMDILEKDIHTDVPKAAVNIKVGWGKYYGPMLEHGTRKMAVRAHLKPLFEQNKEKYYKKMTECIFG